MLGVRSYARPSVSNHPLHVGAHASAPHGARGTVIVLRKRVEGNYEPSGKYQEHLTPMQSLLGALSLANVRVARAVARREHGADKNDG